MSNNTFSITQLIPVDPLAAPDADVRRAARGQRRARKSPYHRDNPAIACRPPRAVANALRATAKKRDISLNALLVEILTEYASGLPSW